MKKPKRLAARAAKFAKPEHPTKAAGRKIKTIGKAMTKIGNKMANTKQPPIASSAPITGPASAMMPAPGPAAPPAPPMAPAAPVGPPGGMPGPGLAAAIAARRRGGF